MKVIKEFPVPATPREVKGFLGTCSYFRKFVQGFSTIAAPLNRLLKKNVTFAWDDGCETAFQKLKEKLTTYPILIYPDFEKSFILHTDASDLGLEAILMQEKKARNMSLHMHQDPFLQQRRIIRSQKRKL